MGIELDYSWLQMSETSLPTGGVSVSASKVSNVSSSSVSALFGGVGGSDNLGNIAMTQQILSLLLRVSHLSQSEFFLLSPLPSPPLPSSPLPTSPLLSPPYLSSPLPFPPHPSSPLLSSPLLSPPTQHIGNARVKVKESMQRAQQVTQQVPIKKSATVKKSVSSLSSEEMFVQLLQRDIFEDFHCFPYELRNSLIFEVFLSHIITVSATICLQTTPTWKF